MYTCSFFIENKPGKMIVPGSVFKENLCFICENLRFFIIGDGDGKEKLMKRCDELNIGYNLHLDSNFDKLLCFTSWIKNMDVATNGLDIIVLTSLNEGTPVSLIEAQASNVPIVTTDVGGIRDIVVNNKTALICKNIPVF